MSVSVVYLAYYNTEAGYSLETVKKFLDSYNNFPAKFEHSLVIIAKNWQDKCEYNKLSILAKNNNAKIIDLPDDGWDIGAYFRVSNIIDSEYILFLGSSTQILHEGWLLKLYNAFQSDKDVKLAGPMGSWGYDIEGLTFPNYHIRTSEFMVERKTFLDYISTQNFPQTKEDTHKIEHGESSLTKYVLNKGFKAVVVNSEGEIFEKGDWIWSNTFNAPGKNKALFSDKRSYIYQYCNKDEKKLFEKANWGMYLNKTKVKIFNTYPQIAPLFVTDIFQPVFLNSNKAPNKITAIKDNIGENIADKYDDYGELTAHYWLWKNFIPHSESEYIGLGQNCRFLDYEITLPKENLFKETFILDFEKQLKLYTEDNIYNQIKDYDVILPQKFNFGKSIYDDYCEYYNKDDIDLAINILRDKYPKYSKIANEFLANSEMYTCWVMTMKKDILKEYFEWIFDILQTFEETAQSTSLNSAPIYIAERFFNIWLAFNVEKNGLKILNTSSLFIPMDL